ncbi:T-cell surface glycoprotein CD1c-like [Leptodactylus fuscus]|uniref:T-cell surface glycoprotein CD1c-like n=1 Tax=Leptodactylus fuscus TaxID=238119 RepID=UPI003F4EA23F
MKIYSPTITMTMILLSIIAGEDSIRIRACQNFQLSDDDVLTLWGTMMAEEIETHALYNDTRNIVFKQSWSKGGLTETDWMFYNMFLFNYFYYFQIHMKMIYDQLGIPRPLLVQCQVGGVAYVDDPESYYFQVAIDGEDTVHLNIAERVWVAQHNKYAQAIKKILDQDKVTIQSIYNNLSNYGQKLARALAVSGKEALSRRTKPEVYFIMKSSKPELVCLATGFYPGSINITLWKDKENMMDNVMVSETLPNGDGTYQERAIVTTGWEEQTTVYCKVEHISLEEPLVRQINLKHNALPGIVIGSILGVVICVTGLIWLVKKRRRSYTSIAGGTTGRIL